MLLEFRDQRNDFLGHKLFGGLPDQPLVVGQIGRRENIFGRDGRDQESTAAIQGGETGVVAMISSLLPT